MEVRGHLDLLLLAALTHSGPAHGYALIATMRDASHELFDLAEGTVYPALHRLELAGEVTSGWESVAGRRRRVYAITPAGTAALAARTREWQAFTHAIAVLIGPTRTALA